MATWPVEYDHDRWNPSEESLIKLSKSISDAEKEPLKVMICPICDHRIAEVSISEKQGIIKLKCQKCKGEYPFNLAYYRRQKRSGYRLNFRIPVYETEDQV